MSVIITISIILLATLSTAFLSSIFGMLGGLILMGILVSMMPVSDAMVLHGLSDAEKKIMKSLGK